MSQENVFIFYNYSNAVYQTLVALVDFVNLNKVDPEVASKLQLQTISLEDNINTDFILIKSILSEINNSYALWVHTGIPDDITVIFSIISLIIISLSILVQDYNTLATQFGFDFNLNETIFILLGATLNETKNNALQLVKKSNILHTSEHYEKAIDHILINKGLSDRFSKEDIFSLLNPLINSL